MAGFVDYNALLLLNDDESDAILEANNQVLQSVLMLVLRWFQTRRKRFLEEHAPLKRRVRLKRDFAGIAARLHSRYFAPNADQAHCFERRFRIGLNRFETLLERLCDVEKAFRENGDMCGRPGITPRVKLCAILKWLGRALPMDEAAEMFEMAESTFRSYARLFCHTMVKHFEKEWIKWPDDTEAKEIADLHYAKHGLPGMLGSIDCMHVRWDRCPTAYHGQFQGKAGYPTLVLEAVADTNLRFMHAHFGAPGKFNDVNIFSLSNVRTHFLNSRWPKVKFSLGEQEYQTPYLLGDGIYPDCKVILKAYQQPITDVEMSFTRAQESARKDIERAFGVLQGVFRIVRSRVEIRDQSFLEDMMRTCVILHNMIVHDGRAPEWERLIQRSHAQRLARKGISTQNGDSFQPGGGGVPAVDEPDDVIARAKSFHTSNSALRHEVAVHVHQLRR